MEKFKIILFLPLIIFDFLFSSPLFSQIALNGTVDKIEYAGCQPHLINGISSVPATNNPLVRHMFMVSPDALALVIDEKACILSNLKPYRPQKNDTIVMGGYHGLNKLLVRNGDTIGYIGGRENNWHRPFNEVVGKSLDLEWISNPQNFAIISSDDPIYANTSHPMQVSRKSAPKELVARLSINPQSLATLRHHIYLKLFKPLSPGKHYRISFDNYAGTFQKDISFCFDDRELRSEAIHVNLYGYGPDDPKVAHLSSWMGDGGALEYPEGLVFRIINLENGQAVFNGPVKLKQHANEPEYLVNGEAYNQNNTFVYEMDFSPLREEGSYKLVIEGISCSFDFLVDRKVWENTARLLMKGFLHQRAGMEVGPPYTDYIRPRNLHPADGHTIHKCNPEKFFAAPWGHFGPILASIMEDTSVPEAWGGWMDAGDYDRRMTHFYSVRRMMYLYELSPEYFEKLDFNIPESSNNIPDILDEGLWCLDLFRRTQGTYEEGAVSWQVESIEHPRHGETSWLNSLPTALLPPSPEACFEYVATASHMALMLKKYDEHLAKKYEKSVLNAMEWAERNPKAPPIRRSGRAEIEALAYLNLYRLTGHRSWHQLFAETLDMIFPEGVFGHLEYNKIDVVAIYALMDTDCTDPRLQEECRTAVVAFADGLLEGAEEATYGILRLKKHPLSRLVSMKSKILPVVVAHKLTGEDKYIRALAKTIQYTMGLNPMNSSFISGLGERSFRPYHHDWHADNMPLPAGIPNFGPVLLGQDTWDLISHRWSDAYLVPMENSYGLYPSKLIDWPMPESCFDQMWVTPVNEFMVQTPMGELLLLTGYLGYVQHKILSNINID